VSLFYGKQDNACPFVQGYKTAQTVPWQGNRVARLTEVDKD